MPATSATPYIVLGGVADEAITFYRSALNAEVADLKKFGDFGEGVPEALRNRIMHAELRIGRATIMVSDGTGEPAAKGRILNIALQVDDRASTQSAFDGLSNGGEVLQPLHESEWGSLFAVVVDRFGVSWMIDGTP